MKILHIKSWSRSGLWPEEKLKYQITLMSSDRLCRRKKLKVDSGQEIMLSLDKVVEFRDNDGLELENGDWVRIKSAQEDVIDIIAKNNEHHSLLAWHLGNRHLAIQVVSENILRILADHVIAKMLEGLEAKIEYKKEVFNPEFGAYGSHHH